MRIIKLFNFNTFLTFLFANHYFCRRTLLDTKNYNLAKENCTKKKFCLSLAHVLFVQYQYRRKKISSGFKRHGASGMLKAVFSEVRVKT